MSGNLCEHCTAVCCRYVALPIETPTESSDFDDIRWYLIHDAISVFVEDGEWFISFASPCRHLQPDHRCGIYETRPQICRKYTTDNCDYHSGDYGWEQHFTAPEHLDAYVQEHPPKGAGKRRGGRRAGVKVRSRRKTKRSLDPTQEPQLDKFGVQLPVLGLVR
jgi:Fe-S-cluster containining protein